VTTTEESARRKDAPKVMEYLKTAADRDFRNVSLSDSSTAAKNAEIT
jgi:hypothetical protein